jgi:peptidoglycan/LPS O-acetylase OafA/YrhL
MRFADTDLERVLAYIAAVLVSIAAAWAFWFLIERPSLAWAGRIKLRGRRTDPDLAAIPAP